MSTAAEKAFVLLFIFTGLLGPGMGARYSSEREIKDTGTEARICNPSNQTGTKEGVSPAKKTGRCKQPNVLLIGFESLRADHVGHLGYFRNTTPTLDELAIDGVTFSRSIATSSWTMATTMSIFTSLYPGVHKTTDWQKKLPEGITTLAEILKKNAYLTAAFVSNPVLGHNFGFSRGFDLYDDFSVGLDIGLNLFGNDRTNQDIYRSGATTSEAVNRVAVAWLKKNYQKPFFMFVFYFDPHYDYIPPRPFDTVFDPNYQGSIDGRRMDSEPRLSTRPAQRDLDYIIALYDGEILYTDGYISKLLEKLREYGVLDETLIIIFGDHGEEFYEHGSTVHGFTLYDEVIHIPLILRWARVIPPSRQISAIVSQVDIMPTILDYLNIEYSGFIQGTSLRPLIEGQKDKLRDTVYAEVSMVSDRVFAAAISKDDKFILDLNTSEKQLFDLNNDPNEEINIYKGEFGESVPLESYLMQRLSDNDRLAEQLCGNENLQKVELDENRLRQLKSLGYIQ